jgi:hypothetical protein
MSLKFSLRDLLILIAVISVACAALANAGIWWHSIVVTATLTGMTVLLIGGTLHAGPSRAFACGWLLFALGYLTMVFGPWFGNHLGSSLITTRGLAQIELHALGNNPSPPVLDFNGGTIVDYDSDNSVDLGFVDAGTYSNTIWASARTSNVFSRSWVTAYTTFQSTGHWLLASAFGFCGAHLAKLLYLRREAANVKARHS